jgi:streptogramin lyase
MRSVDNYLLGLLLLISGCGGKAGNDVANVVPNNLTAQLPNTSETPAEAPLVTHLVGTTKPASSKPVSISLNYIVFHAGSLAQSILKRGMPSGNSRSKLSNVNYGGFTSTASAVTITVNVTPSGGSTTSTSGSCTPNSGGTSGVCTVAFTTPPGLTALSGTFTELGHTIGTFDKTVFIEPGAANTLSLTSNPVVNSVALSPSSASTNAGTSSDTALTVNALDANGNIIAGNSPYVDVNGDPVILHLSVTNNQAGGSGSVTLRGSTTILTPSQSPVFMHYDGKWLLNSVVSVTSSSNAITNLTGTTMSTVPVVNDYSTLTASSSPWGITTGSDGNVWFTENSTGKYGKVTPNGTLSEFSTSSSGSLPQGLTAGPDGNVWFAEFTSQKIGRITPSGSLTEFTLTGSPWSTRLGSDGYIYFVESAANIIGKISTNGSITQFTIPTASSSPAGIVQGPDGNLWFVEHNGNKVGKMTREGIITEYTVPTSGSGPEDIIAGSDGNLWFVENTTNKVCRVTTSGNFTEFTIPSASASLWGMAIGPDDNLWITEFGTGKILRMTYSGVATEFATLSSSSQPVKITEGSDGNMWFTEYGTSKIGRFIL